MKQPNWELFCERLLELDYRKDVRDRNPWIGRVSLYDLIDAFDYAIKGKIVQPPNPKE